jgi:uncharacterized protein (DUF885 family)
VHPPDYRELVRSFLDLRWQLDPVAATQAGVPAHDARLGAFTRADVRTAVAALKAMALAFEGCEPESLADEIDRTAVLNDLRVSTALFEIERPHERNPEFHLSHLLTAYFSLMARADRPADERGMALAGRLAATPRFLVEAQATLTRPPRTFTETAIKVAEGGRTLLAEGVPAFAAGLGPESRAAVMAALGPARVALEDFVAFLAGELFDRSDGDFALGREQFEFRLAFEHALHETAPGLLRYGEAMVRDVEAELARRAESIAPGVPWRVLVERLRNEHHLSSGLVEAYAAEMERAKRFVLDRGLVGIPEGALEVVATPAFMAPLIPFAAYDPPGAFAAARTGTFYVTVPREGETREHCGHELAATALHEGYPGHHLQHLCAQRLDSPVRRVVWSALSVEGWALYCEELMAEQGFYDRPETAFFHQVYLLWRAARIVLDVKLHTMSMPIPEAVTYLTDLLGVPRASAEAEVRRYCLAPGYQLCYAVGRRDLLRLREDYRKRAGSSFSLRTFHDELLRYGGLPVTLVRWGMGLQDA